MAKSTAAGTGTRARSPDAAPRNGKKFLATLQETLSEYPSASMQDIWKWASKQMTGWVAEQKRASAPARPARSASQTRRTSTRRATTTNRTRSANTGNSRSRSNGASESPAVAASADT